MCNARAKPNSGFPRVFTHKLTLSLYDVKPIATRERDYTQLIAVHSLSANALACFMYGFATLCNMDSRAAMIYSLLVVPLYWKYHAQLLVRYPNQTHTFFNHQHPTEDTAKCLGAVVN